LRAAKCIIYILNKLFTVHSLLLFTDIFNWNIFLKVDISVLKL
jgi:hypothetical protein